MGQIKSSRMSVWGGACLSSQSLFPFLLPRATESMWFAEVDESSRLCKLESKLKQEIYDIRNLPARRPIGMTNEHEAETEEQEDDNFASSDDEFEAETEDPEVLIRDSPSEWS